MHLAKTKSGLGRIPTTNKSYPINLRNVRLIFPSFFSNGENYLFYCFFIRFGKTVTFIDKAIRFCSNNANLFL